MKLLLDENLSSQHAVFLREQGYDAVGVTEVGLSGQPDTTIMEFAVANDRVLIVGCLAVSHGNIIRIRS